LIVGGQPVPAVIALYYRVRGLLSKRRTNGCCSFHHFYWYEYYETLCPYCL